MVEEGIAVKLVYFNDFTLGVIKDGNVVDVSSAVQEIPHVGPHDLITRLIEMWETYRGAISKLVDSSQGVPLGQVRLRPPLPRPGKMLCMAGNYMESGHLEEARPLNAFLKSPSSAIGQGDTIILPSAEADVFEHEAELAIVIGKQAKEIKAENAYDHIFGYMNFIDASARGLSGGSPSRDTFYPQKSWHTFGPMGPYLVTADEITDPQNLPVKLWVNGELRQDYPTTDMARTIADSLEWATHILTLDPGDVLACGTNHRGLSPIQNGDVVEIEIPGLGRLRVDVRDELNREWARETRAQKEEREAATGKSS